MLLSDDERRAWRVLERTLTGDRAPGAYPARTEDPWTLTLSAEIFQLFVRRLVLAVGVFLLLTGVLAGVPLFVIAGIAVLALHGGRRRRARRPWLSHREDVTAR